MMPQIQLIKLVNKITNNIDNKSDHSEMQSDVGEFAIFVQKLPQSVAQCTLPLLVTPFLALHSKRDEFQDFNEDTKILFLKVLNDILTKTRIDNENGFCLLFDFLLIQIVEGNPANNLVLAISEEHKQAVLTCFETLFTSMSWDLFPVIYTEKHVPKLCLLLHTCLNLLKREKSRVLRLSALECIMKSVKVDDGADMTDVVLLSQIATICYKFLPGIAGCLIVNAVDDTKCGHKIVTNCVKAWARLVSVILRNYNPNVEVRKLEDLFNTQKEPKIQKSKDDDKLALCAELLMKLTTHDHVLVRKQLAESSNLLITTCVTTLPNTITKIIEILLVLSQDSDETVIELALLGLGSVNKKIIDDDVSVQLIVNNLNQSFCKLLTQIPRIFSLYDEQLSAISLLSGYLRLYSQSNKLKTVLFHEVNLQRLVGCLLHIVQINKGNVSLLEEYKLHDWKQTPDNRTPWKTFKFSDSKIHNKIVMISHYLSEPIIIDMIIDYLLEVYCNDHEQQAEATILMNEIVAASKNFDKTKELLDVYLLDKNWRLSVSVLNPAGLTDDNNSLKQVQMNVIQLCLQLEGIGKMALAFGDCFKSCLLKVLYVVLDKAGSANFLLQAAGLSCVANIALSCGYNSVTDLINHNADYFAYSVTNKLRRKSEIASVLNVLAVVTKHSNMEVLPSISDIIEGVLMQSCDRFCLENEVGYLQVFNVFIKSMHQWLHVKIVVEPVVSRQERERRLEELKRLHWEELSKPVDLSDEIMGKTAEELYYEDLQSDTEQEQHTECEEYVKPTPPKHVQLVVKMLERSLNFLPSKDATCKIFVLEILKSGVEILKDYEDELLPIVHKIWSPLVNRFKEFSVPLIINLSFDLVLSLGRLSKDFIRMRTLKEVLPSINEVLIKQSKESYLKDRGSAYRYTQGYKMQLNILSGIGRLAYDLELDDKLDVVLPAIELYLSSKQPVPLQEAAVNFYKNLVHYDVVNGKTAIANVNSKYQNDQDWNKNLNTLLSITQVINVSH